MRLAEARDRFVSEFSFPVEREVVLDRLGEVDIDAPAGEPDSVADVLGRTDQETFRSADELYDTILTYVGDQYIGRKYYDDRGMNVGGRDDEGVSF
ncbi:MAG: hypothetical protein ABEH77_08280 [Halobacteriaceae archaeon]